MTATPITVHPHCDHPGCYLDADSVYLPGDEDGLGIEWLFACDVHHSDASVGVAHLPLHRIRAEADRFRPTPPRFAETNWTPIHRVITEGITLPFTRPGQTVCVTCQDDRHWACYDAAWDDSVNGLTYCSCEHEDHS